MPIKELDERIRMLPRLGKIKLGKKVSKNGKEYPKAVDYFICPSEVQAIYGEKPKKLEVLLPHEEIDITFPHFYKLYGRQRGLICKGDGETARWKQEDGSVIERQCTCAHLEDGNCKIIGTLNFILPKVEGFGVYQIVTSSFFSCINILDYIELIKSTLGKSAFIPLSLEVKMEEFNPMVNGKQMRTVNPIIHLVLEESFETLARKAKAGVIDKTIRLGLPGTINLEKADSDDEIPEELYPNLMNGKDVQAKQTVSKPDPDAEKITEINKLFGQLQYSTEERLTLQEKHPKPAELLEFLICIKEIRKMFIKLEFSARQQKNAWGKYPDPEMLHQKLKEHLEFGDSENQDSEPENNSGSQETGKEGIPTDIEIDESQTISSLF